MAGNDEYTKLLLHMDDTGLTDSSSSDHIVTLNGSAARSATESKFGGYSATFDGTGDYISIADSDEFNFGSNNFTIDFWVNWNDINTEGHMANQWEDSNNRFQFRLYNDGFTWNVTTGGTNIWIYANSLGLSTGTWYHVALVRDGNAGKIYLNGTNVGENLTAFSTTNPGNYSAPWVIGQRGDGGLFFNGYIDEYRLSNGISRWTSNFTPPTVGYYDSKLSGSLSQSGRIIVINESDWSIEHNQIHSAGAYEIIVEDTKKTMVIRNTDGQSIGYGNLTPITS